MLDWSREGLAWPHREWSRFVDNVEGLRWHVQVAGKGPVVLLLHGTGLGGFSWASTAERLVPTHTVVIPDLPGHAFTDAPPHPDGLGLEAMARGVGALLARLGLVPTLVVGHSAGAALGARLLLDGLPARGFVGVNPAILLRPDPRALPFWPALEWLGTRALLVDAATRFCADRARFAFALRRAAPGLGETELDRYHAVFRQREQHVAAFGMMARWDVRPVRRAVPRLAVPALLLAGERDPWFPPRVVRDLAAEFGRAELAVVAGTGHLSQDEDPDLVASRILGFARRVGA
jgi:magnesium chelatase accessory protein